MQCGFTVVRDSVVYVYCSLPTSPPSPLPTFIFSCFHVSKHLCIIPKRQAQIQNSLVLSEFIEFQMLRVNTAAFQHWHIHIFFPCPVQFVLENIHYLPLLPQIREKNCSTLQSVLWLGIHWKWEWKRWKMRPEAVAFKENKKSGAYFFSPPTS